MEQRCRSHGVAKFAANALAVLAAAPDALLYPRMPIGTWLGAGSAFERAELLSSATSAPGKPAGTSIGSVYGSMPAAWANASAARLAHFLSLLDAGTNL